jgi:hypothetical protein
MVCTIERWDESTAASAASLLGRRPLRRELARTMDKRGGLTTDNLIEGGQELKRNPMFS